MENILSALSSLPTSALQLQVACKVQDSRHEGADVLNTQVILLIPHGMYEYGINDSRYRNTVFQFYIIKKVILPLLGAFAKLWKVTFGFVMSVCPSVLLPLNGFSLNWYLRICQNSVEELHVSLISDKNDGYFTWRPMYIYDISLNSSLCLCLCLQTIPLYILYPSLPTCISYTERMYIAR